MSERSCVNCVYMKRRRRFAPLAVCEWDGGVPPWVEVESVTEPHYGRRFFWPREPYRNCPTWKAKEGKEEGAEK